MAAHTNRLAIECLKHCSFRS